MKNNIIYIMLLSLFAFASCESDTEIDTPSYGNSNWIQFESETASVTEANTINVPVLLASANNASGVTVTFTVTSDATDRFNVTQTGTLEIPAGEFAGNIEIIPVDDNLVNGDATLTIALSNTDVGVGLGGEGVRFHETVVTVVDDDCIPAPSTSYSAAVRAFNDNAPAYDATLTLVPGTTNEYAIDSAWGPDFVGWATGDPSFNGSFPYPARIIINNDLTITIVGSAGYASGGTGTYDSCGDVFSYTLTQGLFSNPFTVDVVLTAN
ncbi:MAG: hypothetical protein JXR05_10210 [Flavobacteriaceae bacterium]